MSTDTVNPDTGAGSIAEAAATFEKILAGPPATREPKGEAEEDPVDETEALEDVPEDEAETPPDEEGAEDEEDADNAEGEQETADQMDQLFPVKINGNEEKVTLREALNGYQRHSDYTRHMAALHNERKEVQAGRDQYAQLLPAVIEVLQQYQTQEPDWDRLYNEDPLEYVRQKEVSRERAEQLQAAQIEHQRVTYLQQQEQAAELQARVEKGRDELFQYNPSWTNKETWERDRVRLRQYGVKQGYSEEEISQAYDPRAVRLLHKAMKYDALMANRPQPVRPEGPRPARPSAPQAAPSRKHSDQSKAKMRLAKTGSLKDAAKVFEGLI